MAAGDIRVLVVDDSVLIREVICDILKSTPGFEVAGVAFDGEEALKVFDPKTTDVVTLDIQMPRKDGLETLQELLARHPVPVIMVSSLTQLGADATFKALDYGALDYIAKPQGLPDKTAFGNELVRKIRSVAGSDVQRILKIRHDRAERAKQRGKAAQPKETAADLNHLADKCVAIGISTGGPPALTSLFESIYGPMPPIVVVQHMPATFTKPFAWRLNSISPLSIKEAKTGDILKPDHVYIAPGGQHLELVKRGHQIRCKVCDGDPVSGHKPSVDVMMCSAARIYGDQCLGAIMTGMGRDGADGCQAIRAAGGDVLGQDEASSDVYGMNKVAFVAGHVDRKLDLEDAASIFMKNVKLLWGSAKVGV